MQQIHGFDFYALNFDRNGDFADPAQREALKQAAQQATDAIWIAHGFRNNEQDATAWYTRFLETFRSHFSRAEFAGLKDRKWIVVAVYWPSKALPEGPSKDGQAQSLDGDDSGQEAFIKARLEELKADLDEPQRARIDQAIGQLSKLQSDPKAQDEFVNALLSAVENKTGDPNEGLEFLRSKSGPEVFDALSLRRPRQIRHRDDEEEGGALAGVAAPPVQTDNGGALGLGEFFGGALGKAGQLVNLTTWYLMKDRAGIAGANGVAQSVRDLKAAKPALRIHLAGHSLGGRLMAACLKSLASDRPVKPDSVTLLQAAFSHYGFSKALGNRPEGFFRSVIDRKAVKGPLLATFSELDSVVGRVYSLASLLAGDNVKKLGDKDSPFGGIGHNGCQQMTEMQVDKLHPAGTPYSQMTQTDVVTCLDGSGQLITSHGDITNPNVTYAFASAVALT